MVDYWSNYFEVHELKQPGRAISMKLPGETKWFLRSCVKIFPNCSFEVEVAGRHYRRNRRQLRTTAETPPPSPLEEDLLHDHPQAANPPSTSQDVKLAINHDQPAVQLLITASVSAMF